MIDRSLVASIRSDVARRLAAHQGARGDDGERILATRLVTEALEAEAQRRIAAHEELLAPPVEGALAKAVHDALFGLGALQPYLEDERITDLHAQGCDQVFVVYENGRKEQVGSIAGTDDELVDLLRTIAARCGRSERPFDTANPELNIQLPDGSRLFALMAVSARVSLAVRRHRFPKVFLSDLVALGTLDTTLAAFLAAAVRARKNLIVAGGTGAGKTTLLRALINEIRAHERLITIEDALELGADRFPELHPDVVTLEARRPNVEGEGEITLEHLVRMGLRMDPDRVIVGEVRGDEILPMLNAMSQGNDGSMCTVHAHSSESAFRKLAMYAMQTPQRLPIEATNLLVANAVHFVVHLARDVEAGGRGPRYLSSVREVVDADGPRVVTNEVFRPGPDGRAMPGAPFRPRTLHDLAAAGFDPALLARGEAW